MKSCIHTKWTETPFFLRRSHTSQNLHNNYALGHMVRNIGFIKVRLEMWDKLRSQKIDLLKETDGQTDGENDAKIRCFERRVKKCQHQRIWNHVTLTYM